MNKMRLEQNEIGKNLSHSELRKSCPNGTRLIRNETKGAMNEMRLEQIEICKNLSLTEWRKSCPNGRKLKWGQGKSTYTFSAQCWQFFLLSSHFSLAFRSPACWLYPLKPGGEQKFADVRRKTVTLIYLDPLKWNETKGMLNKMRL
jgi:hypothetical protein